MIAKNNEEKRSKLWNIAMTTSTIILVLIAVFFIVKIFVSNPLKGTWINDGGSLTITFGSEDAAEVQWPEQLSDLDVKVKMHCEIDKKNKTVQLQLREAEVNEAVEATDGAMTAQELTSALSSIQSTFDYSVEGPELTLTDREYGEQLFFEKE